MIKSKSYQSVLKAIMGGVTDAEELVKLVHGRTVNKHGHRTIKAAVTGLFSKTDLTVPRQTKAVIDMIELQLEECRRELTDLCETHFPDEYR